MRRGGDVIKCGGDVVINGSDSVVVVFFVSCLIVLLFMKEG